MWKYISLLIGGAVIVAVASFAYLRHPAEASTEAPAVVAAPVWVLKDLDGRTVSSAQFHGKVVILNFWATWCPPCRAEIPGFVELQKAYGEQGLVVIGVSMDHAGPAVVKDFMRQNGMNYPVVMGDDAINQAFGGIEGLPTTFIINRAGALIDRHVGYTDKADFERAIRPLL